MNPVMRRCITACDEGHRRPAVSLPDTQLLEKTVRNVMNVSDCLEAVLTENYDS